jgi:hypothetical protein
VKKASAYVLAAVCLFITYQGYENSRLRPNTHDLSIQAAERISAVDESRPREQRTDPVRRRYEWHTSIGPVVVTCQREFVFLGDWSCTAVQGSLGAF